MRLAEGPREVLARWIDYVVSILTGLLWVVAIVLLSRALGGCSPPGHPTPGDLAVTGSRLSEAEQQLLDTWYRDVRLCAGEHGVPVRNRLRHVHVHSTCWFKSGRRYVRGSTNLRDSVDLGRDLRAFRHEAVSTVTGTHSHAPDHVTILCEHAGDTRPLPYSCEPEPRGASFD